MAKYKKKLDDDIRCPLEYGLAIFGGKWKSRIICVLVANERLRYSQIRKEMYNITDAVLAATLKDLIEDGIIDRKRSLAAGLIIQKILNENGLSEDSLKYSENGKPFADNLFLMYPMQEIMWSECPPIVKSGVTLKKLWMHHLELPTVFFI